MPRRPGRKPLSMEPSGWAGGGGSASGCRSTASRLFHGSPAPRRVGMMVDVSSRPSCVGWSGVRGACGLEGVAALSEVGVVAPRSCSSPPSGWRWGRPKGPLRLLHVEDRGRSLGQPSGSSPPGAPHLVLSRPRLFIARAHGLSEAVRLPPSIADSRYRSVTHTGGRNTQHAARGGSW